MQGLGWSHNAFAAFSKKNLNRYTERKETGRGWGGDKTIAVYNVKNPSRYSSKEKEKA